MYNHSSALLILKEETEQALTSKAPEVDRISTEASWLLISKTAGYHINSSMLHTGFIWYIEKKIAYIGYSECCCKCG